MGWLYVIIAGLIEIFWVLGLKLAGSIPGYILVGVLIFISFFILLKAFEKLPISTVYASFTGIGTVGIVLIEIAFLKTPFTPTKIFFIALITAGIIGLKLISKPTEEHAQATKKEN
ncbi:MAG: DMT family transporter [Bacillota bacterium]|jgi:paired small multidrug resistance pump